MLTRLLYSGKCRQLTAFISKVGLYTNMFAFVFETYST